MIFIIIIKIYYNLIKCYKRFQINPNKYFEHFIEQRILKKKKKYQVPRKF